MASQDFSKNLRGRSFKGQNLEGKDFSGADIRGANFTNAYLKGANFSGADAGLQKRWVILLVLIVFFFVAVSELAIVIECYFISLIFSINSEYIAFGWTSLVLFTAFYFVTIRRVLTGLSKIRVEIINETRSLVLSLSVVFILSMLVLMSVLMSAHMSVQSDLSGLNNKSGVAYLRDDFTDQTINKSLRFVQNHSLIQQPHKSYHESEVLLSRSLPVPASVAVVVPASVAVVVAVVVAVAIILLTIGSGSVAIAIILAVQVPRIGIIVGSGSGFLSIVIAISIDKYEAIPLAALASAVSVAVFLLNGFIAGQAIEGNEQYSWIRTFAINFATIGSTSFRNANLTDADFTRALLRNTKFNKANLTRTRFFQAKELDLASVGNSILANFNVLNLLVTNNGNEKNYSGLNLVGANLIGANMEAANLKGGNINEATFIGANLEWANLSFAQAVGTNFTNVQMTGACIEAWNIESSTKLDNVDCRFIFLLEHLNKVGERERRPSSGEFKPGEFTKLFEEALNTIDLIFREGIDWRAFVTAFKKIQVENQETELAIQSVENKGDGIIVVRVAVSENANKEKIHSEFNQNYELDLKAIKEEYIGILKAREEEIYRQSMTIEGMIKALAKPTIIQNTLENRSVMDSPGSFSVGGSVGGNINNVQGDGNKVAQENTNMTGDRNLNISGGTVNASGAGALSLGDISGTVANTINQLPSTSEPNKPGIKQLLEQLKTAIESESSLSDEDKADALEHVQTLAEAGQKPQEASVQKPAKVAIQALKGIFSSLPDVAKLAEAGKTLIPLIAHIFGL